MSKSFRLTAALVLAVASMAQTAEVRITDHDQRFRTKYGVWPPHVRRAIETEQARERSRKEEPKRAATTDEKTAPEQANDSKPGTGSNRACDCDRQAK